jgi:hypothetical protein
MNLYGFLGNDAISCVDPIGFVLYAVGGTNSAADNINTNNRTHVWRFYDAFVYPGKKLYHDGPDGPSGNFFGNGVSDLAEKGYNFICAELAKQKNVKQPWLNDPIILVGHSRGGLIVMLVAEKLMKGCPCKDGKGAIDGPIPVRFMGLFDAVAMTPNNSAGPISNNVEFAAHGIRDPAAGSRSSWGNTGLEGANLLLIQDFYGNHSAMGGDPGHGDQLDEIGVLQNVKASVAIDKFICENAQDAGVVLGNN